MRMSGAVCNVSVEGQLDFTFSLFPVLEGCQPGLFVWRCSPMLYLCVNADNDYENSPSIAQQTTPNHDSNSGRQIGL